MGRGVLLLLGVALPGCAERTSSAAPAPVVSEDASVAIVKAPEPPPPPAGPVRVLVAGDLLPHRPALVAPDAIKNALAPLSTLF